MDVMRTGCSALGAVLPEKEDHNLPGARDIADRLIASFGSMLLYWYHYSHERQAHRSRDRRRFDRRRTSCICCTASRRRTSWVRAMHTSLNLYAEHEFNASTFAARVVAGTGSDMYSAITGGDRRAARPQARRRERSRLRSDEPLRDARRRRERHRHARRASRRR